jgi:hypothetical protein
VQVNVQQRRTGSRHAVFDGLLDPGFVVQALGIPKVNVKVAARERHAVAGNEIVFAFFVRFHNGIWNWNRNGLRSGAVLSELRYFDSRSFACRKSHVTHPNKRTVVDPK